MGNQIESQEEYLDRICNVSKPKKKRKRKAKNTCDSLIFGRSWEEIQSMQNGTHNPRLI